MNPARCIAAMFFALVCAQMLQAQTDTLAYDGIRSVVDGQLVAVTMFPGEIDVIHTTRFTPADRCRLEGILLGGSVVRFAPAAVPDTLVVFVYEMGAVPPSLASVGRTYRFPIGSQGFPAGNINYENPLGSAERGVMSIPLSPAVTFAPAREFHVGVRLQSAQRFAVGTGQWNGLTVAITPYSAEHARYGRYRIANDPAYNRKEALAGGLNAAMYMRALVHYDPTIPDTPLTGAEAAPAPVRLELAPVHPNPARSMTTLGFTLTEAAQVRIDIIDAMGRVQATPVDSWYEAGAHESSCDAAALGAGVYFVRLHANGAIRSRMLTVLR